MKNIEVEKEEGKKGDSPVTQPTYTDSIRVTADETEIAVTWMIVGSEQGGGEARGAERTWRDSPEAQYPDQDTTPAPHTDTDLEPTPVTVEETADTRAARIADLVREAQLAITPSDVLKSVVHFTNTSCYQYEAGEL
jgi:hypothetical protein